MPLYRKKGVTPLEPWTPETDMYEVSVSAKDSANGSPKVGDMIASNPVSPRDRWLVSQAYFIANYELAEEVSA